MGKWMKLLLLKIKFFFILTELEAISFHNHFMAYEVERTDNKAVVLRHDLPWHGMLHIVQKNGKEIHCGERHFLYRDTLQRRSFLFYILPLLTCI